MAAGIALIGLGTLIISAGSRVALGVNIEDKSEYLLTQADRDVMRAGVLITASGTIAVSVSLASMIMFWKRDSQISAVRPPKEE